MAGFWRTETMHKVAPAEAARIFGLRMAERMRDVGMTEDRLALIVGTDVQTISRIGRGRATAIRLDLADRIAGALGGAEASTDLQWIVETPWEDLSAKARYKCSSAFKDARRAYGVSVADLAACAGITARALSAVESGFRMCTRQIWESCRAAFGRMKERGVEHVSDDEWRSVRDSWDVGKE